MPIPTYNNTGGADGLPPMVRSFIPAPGTLIMRVSGDSMNDAGILDGDYLYVDTKQAARNGSIVAAYLDGEQIVKRYEDRNGSAWLHAENPKYMDIEVAEYLSFHFIGVVVGLMRSLV